MLFALEQAQSHNRDDHLIIPIDDALYPFPTISYEISIQMLNQIVVIVENSPFQLWPRVMLIVEQLHPKEAHCCFNNLLLFIYFNVVEKIKVDKNLNGL